MPLNDPLVHELSMPDYMAAAAGLRGRTPGYYGRLAQAARNWLADREDWGPRSQANDGNQKGARRMTTGPEHYLEAEKWLAEAERLYRLPDDYEAHGFAPWCASLAQAHATLAVAAAVALGAESDGNPPAGDERRGSQGMGPGGWRASRGR